MLTRTLLILIALFQAGLYGIGFLAAGTAVLTLITCYPFYFVGSAPERFIVRATLN